jgi:cell division septation protein DedD
MAESKIRNAFSRSTIFTVGRLLAFIGIGFAIGLVIGVVSEEPELLAGHLRGDTETIELDAALAARPDEDALAAAAADLAAVGESVPSEGGIAIPFEAESGGELPDVAAGPAAASSQEESGAWAIQVGAFGDEPSAAQLADRLEGRGYPIEVLPAGAESSRWRVRVQPIEGEAAARTTAERVEREERLPTWVIRLEGRSRP